MTSGSKVWRQGIYSISYWRKKSRNVRTHRTAVMILLVTSQGMMENLVTAILLEIKTLL